MLGRRTRPLLGREQVRAIEIIGCEEAYPTKRQDQQRRTSRSCCGSGEVPMSRLMFVIVEMTRMNTLRMRMDRIMTVRTGIRNLGQMKVGKVVTVVMVMKSCKAPGRAVGVKEDQRPAARCGENRLPVSDQSARPVHHL
jgi:hypothetical protein